MPDDAGVSGRGRMPSEKRRMLVSLSQGATIRNIYNADANVVKISEHVYRVIEEELKDLLRNVRHKLAVEDRTKQTTYLLCMELFAGRVGGETIGVTITHNALIGWYRAEIIDEMAKLYALSLIGKAWSCGLLGLAEPPNSE